jgi:acetolactate synthase-1/3 small subunit
MTNGDEKTFSQIMKQTGKLVETKLIFSVEPTFSLIHEILSIKFAAEERNNEKLKDLISIYGAKVVDTTDRCMTVELTDTPQRIDGFIEDTAKHHVIDMCRSGAIAMERGDVVYNI